MGKLYLFYRGVGLCCVPGYNMLLVGIAGPRVPCEQLSVVHMNNLKYVVKYRLSQPGDYQLIVKWGDQHIRGSPFSIRAQ